jgi:D-alanine-D-alanine ligase
MKKTTVALLAGGWSRERDVSRESGEAVYKALDPAKYDAIVYDPRRGLEELIEAKEEVDIAFNLLHGKYGEDGCIQGVLEILGIPFVGSGLLSSAMAMNKSVAKGVFKNRGLRVPGDIILKRGEAFSAEAIMHTIGPVIVVKPVAEGSSLGISVCSTIQEIGAGIKKAFEFDREVMVEEYIEGREVTACILGDNPLHALPIVEIVPETSRFFDYEAKYGGATREICPAQLPERLTQDIQRCAKEAHLALRCSVWSRTDMIIDGDDKVYLLETNTIPGMTRTSLFPLAAKTAGISFPDLLDRLITLSLERENGKSDA